MTWIVLRKTHALLRLANAVSHLHSTCGWEIDLLITSHVFEIFANLGPHHNQHDYFWCFSTSLESQLDHITDSFAVGIRLNGYKSLLWEIRKCGSPFTKQTCFWIACSNLSRFDFEAHAFYQYGTWLADFMLCWEVYAVTVTVFEWQTNSTEAKETFEDRWDRNHTNCQSAN